MKTLHATQERKPKSDKKSGYIRVNMTAPQEKIIRDFCERNQISHSMFGRLAIARFLENPTF